MSRLALPAAVVVTALSIGAGSGIAPKPARASSSSASAAAKSNGDEPLRGRAACPDDFFPDGYACVRLPNDAEGGPELLALVGGHHDRSGRWTTYDQIPRRPDRPADYDAYVYPIPPGIAGGHYVVSGYDLDLPDARQRRGATLSHVGHGGVDLPQRMGEPIKMITLEHQEGDAEVIYTGPLFGTTVLTKHVLREGAQRREYILLFGHLDSIAPGLTRGAPLHEGDLVGTVGNTSSPELVHLHLEARRVRDGIDLSKLSVASGAGALIQNEISIVCDPRNVLPLKR